MLISGRQSAIGNWESGIGGEDFGVRSRGFCGGDLIFAAARIPNFSATYCLAKGFWKVLSAFTEFFKIFFSAARAAAFSRGKLQTRPTIMHLF
jgi:hypothetical protein